jgi:hypothetical protein
MFLAIAVDLVIVVILRLTSISVVIFDHPQMKK